jgi:enoyl-CoA hydratase/carnithine racemase
MSEPVNVERRGNIAYVRLSRPDKRNAVNFAVMNGLMDAAKALRKDRALRAIIIHGEGESFCSGLDFPEVMSKPSRVARGFLTRCGLNTNLFQEMCWAWRRLPVPVIAVLHGHCFGAGIQLALAADFRIATPDCQLAILEAKWGLIPDMSGSAALRELISIDQAKLLTMTGRVISGEEARAIGLVTALSDDPMAAAEALAEELSARSPDAVAMTKTLFQKTWIASEKLAFRVERRLQAAVLLGANQRAAMKAAMKKRAPKYSARSWWIR